MGTLDLVVGPMFAGKTTELMRRYERSKIAGRDVLFMRPHMDTREAITHAGVHVPCSYVRDAQRVLDTIAYFSDPLDPQPMDHLIIDEVQFLDMDGQLDFVDRLQEYLGQSKLIITCGGLDTDQAGRPFPTVALLLAAAESVTKLTAVCACGSDATRSSWISELEFSSETRIGGADRYKPACRDCFRPVGQL